MRMPINQKCQQEAQRPDLECRGFIVNRQVLQVTETLYYLFHVAFAFAWLF